MAQMIEELGGPEKAADRMRRRGFKAVELAIHAAGGIAEVAKALGITRGALYARLKRPADEWPHGDLRKLSEMSRISVEMITSSVIEEPTPDNDAQPLRPRPRRS